MDFTLKIYKQLLEAFKTAGYSFIHVEDFYTYHEKLDKFVMLRHDVDRKPGFGLKMAKLENSLGIPASYYFRMVKESYHEPIIEEMVTMEHELGYHYEDLAMARGDYDRAIHTFQNNLDRLRRFYPVKTACMHGNPLSPWDNRLIWNRYRYRDHGIILEPYYDIDYSDVFYLTDTGRRWNNRTSNVRDRVESRFHYSFKSTSQIIAAIESGDFPDKVLINTHPERWTDRLIPWTRQLVVQNLKNVVKRAIAKYRVEKSEVNNESTGRN